MFDNERFVTKNISELLLDDDNPRHDPIYDQEDIIDYLINNEDVRVLSKDIIGLGRLSPLDVLGIIRDDESLADERYIVVEGNRRACALKLIDDPSLAPKKDRNYFEALNKKSSEISRELRCYLFVDREDSDEWRKRRHGGALGGYGTKSWNPAQSSRFLQKPTYALGSSVLDYAIKHNLIRDQKAQKKIITTISRLFGTPDTRLAFGIVSKVTDANVKINVPYEEFDQAIEQFFIDMPIAEYNIGSRSTKEDRIKYISVLVDKGKLPKTILETPIDLSSRGKPKKNTLLLPEELDLNNPNINIAGGVETVEGGKQDVVGGGKPIKLEPPVSISGTPNNGNVKSNQDRLSRKNLIDYSLSISETKLRSIFGELKYKISVHETPYASAMLLRAFIELSCDYFICELCKENIQYHDGEKNITISERAPLPKKIRGIANFIRSQQESLINEKDLVAIEQETRDTSKGNGDLNLLHSALHNYRFSFQAVRVITAHDNFKPLISAIWNWK